MSNVICIVCCRVEFVLAVWSHVVYLCVRFKCQPLAGASFCQSLGTLLDCVLHKAGLHWHNLKMHAYTQKLHKYTDTHSFRQRQRNGMLLCCNAI